MYAWSLGSKPCSNDVLDWLNPFNSHRDSSSWSYTGARGNIGPLPEGRYYFNVRAFNSVIRGGPLSTTVCNTVPLAVDITKPIMHSFNITYNDDREALQYFFNVTYVKLS